MRRKNLLIVNMVKKDAIVGINSETVIHFKFDKPTSELQYSDNIDDEFLVRTYSAKKDGMWSNYQSVSRLLVEKEVDEIKIRLTNNGTNHLSGCVGLKPLDIDDDSNEIPIVQSHLDLLSIGNSVSSRELSSNYYINLMSPIIVNYSKIELDKDSTDHLLGEISLANVKETKCVKLVTKKNSLPKEEEAEYTEWGYQFSSFLGYFSKKYFEEQFGEGTKPLVGDYLSFMLIGRAYYVSAVTNLEGINGRVYGYQIALKHYAEDTAIGKAKSTNTLIDDLLNEQEKFFPAVVDEGKHTVDDQQNSTAFIHDDPVRYLVSELVDILPVKNRKFKKQNYYQTNKETEERESVIYAANVTTNKDFSLSFMIDGSSIEENLIFSVGGFQVIIINNIYHLYYKGLSFNTNITKAEGWDHVLINVFNSKTLIEFIVVADSDFTRIKVEFSIDSAVELNNHVLALIHNPFKVSRIRLWKKTVPQEYEKRVLNSDWVEKPDVAYIIDNVKPIFNSRTHIQSQIMTRNQGEILDKIYSYTTDFDSVEEIRYPASTKAGKTCKLWNET